VKLEGLRPSYRLVEQDQAFFERDEVRGLRLHAEYLKPELLLREHTVVVYGSTRIEPATAARNVKALQQALQTSPGAQCGPQTRRRRAYPCEEP
jgi:hypothetical protein